jgi:hypothetical protein
MIRKRGLLVALVMLTMNCSSNGGDDSNDPKNAYFTVDRKDVDKLTPATVLSLRTESKVDKIPEYLSSLCKDYSWMNSKRFIHIFADPRYSKLFDSFGIENIKSGKPVDKYVALFNPDEQSLIFFPLVRGKTKKVRMREGWCAR